MAHYSMDAILASLASNFVVQYYHCLLDSSQLVRLLQMYELICVQTGNPLTTTVLNLSPEAEIRNSFVGRIKEKLVLELSAIELSCTFIDSLVNRIAIFCGAASRVQSGCFDILSIDWRCCDKSDVIGNVMSVHISICSSFLKHYLVNHSVVLKLTSVQNAVISSDIMTLFRVDSIPGLINPQKGMDTIMLIPLGEAFAQNITSPEDPEKHFFNHDSENSNRTKNHEEASEPKVKPNTNQEAKQEGSLQSKTQEINTKPKKTRFKNKTQSTPDESQNHAKYESKETRFTEQSRILCITGFESPIPSDIRNSIFPTLKNFGWITHIEVQPQNKRVLVQFRNDEAVKKVLSWGQTNQYNVRGTTLTLGLLSK